MYPALYWLLNGHWTQFDLPVVRRVFNDYILPQPCRWFFTGTLVTSALHPFLWSTLDLSPTLVCCTVGSALFVTICCFSPSVSVPSVMLTLYECWPAEVETPPHLEWLFTLSLSEKKKMLLTMITHCCCEVTVIESIQFFLTLFHLFFFQGWFDL